MQTVQPDSSDKKGTGIVNHNNPLSSFRIFLILFVSLFAIGGGLIAYMRSSPTVPVKLRRMIDSSLPPGSEKPEVLAWARKHTDDRYLEESVDEQGRKRILAGLAYNPYSFMVMDIDIVFYLDKNDRLISYKLTEEPRF